MFIKLLGSPLKSWNPTSYVKTWLRKYSSATDTQTRMVSSSDKIEKKHSLWHYLHFSIRKWRSKTSVQFRRVPTTFVGLHPCHNATARNTDDRTTSLLARWRALYVVIISDLSANFTHRGVPSSAVVSPHPPTQSQQPSFLCPSSNCHDIASLPEVHALPAQIDIAIDKFGGGRRWHTPRRPGILFWRGRRWCRRRGQ